MQTEHQEHSTVMCQHELLFQISDLLGTLRPSVPDKTAFWDKLTSGSSPRGFSVAGTHNAQML